MKTPLPNNILKRMAPEDRAPMGNAGMLQSEIEERDLARRESQLQADCALILRHAGIWYQKADMRYKTHNTPGCPDFLFAINGKACAVECKVEGRKLESDQIKARDAMSENGWQHAVCETAEQFRDTLRAWGCDHTVTFSLDGDAKHD